MLDIENAPEFDEEVVVLPAKQKGEIEFTIDEPAPKQEPIEEEEEVEEEDLFDEVEEPEVETEKLVIRGKEDGLDMEVEEGPSDETYVGPMENYDPTLDLPRYKYPTPNLLIDYPVKDIKVSKEELEENKNRIVNTLINFKIGISSIKATIGPTVTLYEIIPEAGVKISKIKNLEDDIALSLAALGIRIIAPIPGKGTIGIEVPNKNREMVDAKSVITTEKFMKSTFELPIVLGKTISNEVFVTDLAKCLTC
jgi:S-DNA-T family DNA segregation ATPase FtsK/SpoIIIE